MYILEGSGWCNTRRIHDDYAIHNDYAIHDDSAIHSVISQVDIVESVIITTTIASWAMIGKLPKDQLFLEPFVTESDHRIVGAWCCATPKQ